MLGSGAEGMSFIGTVRGHRMEDRKRNEDITEEVGETGIKIRTWRPDATASIPTQSSKTGDNSNVQG
jgi:hypothetical protein